MVSLIFVQWMEVIRKQRGSRASACGTSPFRPAPQAASSATHKSSPGIIDHWKGSTHAVKGVGCVECHQADKDDADAFDHYGALIATVVTPRDCGRCHKTEAAEFAASHHAKAGNILASLDNFLAETVEGSRVPFQPALAHAGPRCRTWSTAWPASTPAASSATAARSRSKRPTEA